MKFYLKSDAPAQQWIDAGLAKRAPKARNADLHALSFLTAQAKALVYLTGDGAQMLDRIAKEQRARP